MITKAIDRLDRSIKRNVLETTLGFDRDAERNGFQSPLRLPYEEHKRVDPMLPGQWGDRVVLIDSLIATQSRSFVETGNSP